MPLWRFADALSPLQFLVFQRWPRAAYSRHNVPPQPVECKTTLSLGCPPINSRKVRVTVGQANRLHAERKISYITISPRLSWRFFLFAAADSYLCHASSMQVSLYRRKFSLRYKPTNLSSSCPWNPRPKPLVGLKQMTKTDAERTLKNRLRDAGAKFKGPFPSTREVRYCKPISIRVAQSQIKYSVVWPRCLFSSHLFARRAFFSLGQIAQARRKTETAKDLEGIDMSNVVAGSRRRRRSEDDDTSPPKKKRRSVEDSDIECSGEESSSEEDSEDEYQLSV